MENGLEILNTQSTFEKKLEQIAAVDCYFITTSKLQEIQRETAVDDTLQYNRYKMLFITDGQRIRRARNLVSTHIFLWRRACR